MADLSAVLRKTIDGLPKPTPQLRAKVYEKARAAIARQIETADPPVSQDVAQARHAAIEDAIERTEDHYRAAESAAGDAAEAAPARMPPPPIPATPLAAASTVKPAPAAPAPPVAAPPMGAPPIAATPRRPVPSAKPSLPVGPVAARPDVASGAAPASGLQKPSWLKASANAAPAADRRDPTVPSPALPGGVPGQARLSPVGSMPADEGESAAAPRRDPEIAASQAPFSADRSSDAFDGPSIPAADLAAPRYANGRRKGEPRPSRVPIFASLAVLLLAGGGTAAYIYQDEVQTLLGSSGPATATSPTPAATETAALPSDGAPAPATTPTAPTTPGTTAPVTTAPATATELPESAPRTALPAPDTAVPSQTGQPAPTRRYTQRLMPDGTEVDAGPGASNTNAFEEGTNIAAASPEAPEPAVPQAPTATAESPPGAADAGSPEATPPGEAAVSPPQTTAALQPDTVAAMPAVGQKAVFYEERSQTEQGTQIGGSVVWTVVNEPPAEGLPAEPAIRAVADVPEQNMRMTMTIRRNADATLPASHVIELMFDVPSNFAGGQIANVQRLALKPTEEARGEPLIGVAGKISDGFFIIALNNLAEATETNVDLMRREQWIDIPLAYATGRRALISIEKGIPGERAFTQALDAWATKT